MSVPLQRQGTNSKNRRSQYTYTADGRKLRVVQKWNPNYNEAPVAGATVTPSLLASSKTTDHIGNKTYENGTLKRILVEGGYIQGGKYYFYQTDHLRNNGVVLDANGGRIEDSHYYPFGMTFDAQTSTQPYKYNGKELDQMHGLNQYDYSARYYEPAIGRFTTVDPHAEKYYSHSPYAYVGNNPLKYTDPTGMDWYTNKENGNIIFVKGVDDLSTMSQELIDTYAIGDISQYERLGADDMFGNNVTWGIYGEDGGSFNVLETSFLALEDLSANFMDLQGFEKVVSSKTTVEKNITRTLPEANKRLGKTTTFKDIFPISEKTEYTYVNKGLSEMHSRYSFNYIEPPKTIGAGMTTSVEEHKTTYTYKVPQKRSWLGNLWHKMTNF